MQITVQLFGALSSYANNGKLALTVDEGSVVADLRKALGEVLKKQHPDFSRAELITYSVFADEKSILDENATVTNGDNLAILPPVSGG